MIVWRSCHVGLTSSVALLGGYKLIRRLSQRSREQDTSCCREWRSNHWERLLFQSADEHSTADDTLASTWMVDVEK